MSVAPYPVRLEGHLDPGLNRWLWLVKWVLVIPHAIVLAFLWIAFVVLSFAAFFSILFSGRYPRSIFDFNLGVLRWTWRVAFYAYSALGTDQYPPFTLADVPEYPARVDVAYPERLSRGLVAFKWLLGLPHYLIVALLAGGGTWLLLSDDGDRFFNGGLVTLLVLVAGVVLLFTGAYPKQIFDLVLGLNRWIVRVGAYAALMTDVYPPFRLDMGEDEPGTVTLPPPAAPAAPAAPTAASPAPWGVGRTIAIVVAGLTGLIALALGTAALMLVWADQTQRDGDGFLMTPTEQLSTGTYALVSEPLHIADLDGPDWVYADDLLGRMRVRVDGDAPLFVGLAPTAAVERYLSGVAHEQVRGLGDDDYEFHAGDAPVTPPQDAGLWAATAQGAGEQALTWDVREGEWSIVAMKADGSRGVTADVSVGARLDDLGWIAAAVGLAALVALLVTGALIAAAVRGRTA